MAKARLLFAGLWVGLGVAGVAQGTAVGGAPASAPTKKMCAVNSLPPTPAETALNKGDYAPAEKLFRDLLAKNADNEVAHEELVRALIGQDKVDAAAKDAEAWAAAAPSDSLALTALGDVRLRQGDPRGAFVQFQKAVQAEPCNARAYYSASEVDGLAGMFASSKRLIERAYALHPTDDDINVAWIETRQRSERLAKLADYAEHSDQISEDNRAKMKTSLAKASQTHTSDCRMAATSPRDATVQMAKVMDGPDRFLSWGLDVKFNGKSRRLEIDTGASGITISRAAAIGLGIQREDVTKTAGIGDEADVKTSVAHLASVKIGGIEFTNCPVEILEKWSVLDSDGLIGGDVFHESLLTLDFPKHELRIAPLPERPGEKKVAASDAVGDDQEEPAHDPYIAPEMVKWMRIYRSGHELLMPTDIVDSKRAKDESAWKDKLFLLDTGADDNLISATAAKEVTKVSRDYDNGIRGISGEVDKVYEAGKFTLAFAGLRLNSPNMTAIDLTKISHDSGVEVSGLIGAPALFQLAMNIDYRDNLVMFEYTPPK